MEDRTLKLSYRLGLLVIFLASLYPALNIAREPLHSLHGRWDELVPFVPIFAVPYLSFYVYLLVTALLLLGRRQWALMNQALLASCLTLAVAYLAYGYYQTFVARPVVEPTSLGWQLVSFVYRNDNPYNAFPSLHTALSAICAQCFYRRPKTTWLMIGWAVLIIISTVLVKQHYLADLMAGLLLAGLTFLVSGAVSGEHRDATE